VDTVHTSNVQYIVFYMINYIWLKSVQGNSTSSDIMLTMYRPYLKLPLIVSYSSLKRRAHSNIVAVCDRALPL
jgi:hypothetical protein